MEEDKKTIIMAIVLKNYNSVEEAEEHVDEILQQVDEIQKFLAQQRKTYQRLRESKGKSNNLQVNKKTGEAIFDEGTLIHCASECSYEKLLNIKDKGIMAGDFIGIPEFNNQETFYCADFYRADQKMNSTNFFERIRESDSHSCRSPFSEQWKHCLKLAFIINPNAELKDLMDTDMYKKQNSDHIMQKMLHLLEKYMGEKNGQVSAIPYGIPSNFLSGIVVGDYLLQNEEYMRVLQQVFPDCYILTHQGKTFFNPALSKEENETQKNECLKKLRQFRETQVQVGDTAIGRFLKNVPKEIIQPSEEEFKISSDKLQILNGFIHENLKSRRNSTNYNLLHKISEMMSKGLKVADRHINSITTPSTEDQTKKIALQFFRGLDRELYEKAKGIIEGNSDIDFNMYKLDKNEDFSKKKSDGMPIHTKKPCVMSNNNKSAIYVPCKGTVEDIYLLVHELSHTFDLVRNDNPTRNMLGEVTPFCFEAMLSQYLLENGIATREDIINREKGATVSHYDDGVETFAKLELMRIKEQQGDIRQENLTAMQKKYGITNRQLGYVLRRLMQSEPNVDYRARYMIAQLIYPHYMEQYEQNPQNAIKTLKEYFEQIKSNNFEGSLRALGIQPNLDIVSELIETSNRRINNLRQPILFSENEIGRATINVPTESKDNAQSRQHIDEKQNENKVPNIT